MSRRLVPVLLVLIPAAALSLARARQTPAPSPAEPLVTGKSITPEGTHVPVGSFPANLIASPDGRFVVVSSLGARCQLTVLRAETGEIVSTVPFVGPSETSPGKRKGLYLGLAFAPDGRTLYAARGSDDVVSVLSFTPDGALTDTGKTLPATRAAGIAVTPEGRFLVAAQNSADPARDMASGATVIDLRNGQTRSIPLPGYPLAVAAGPEGRVYVSSEQRGCVSVLDPDAGVERTRILTGTQPAALLLDRTGSRLFVANAGSDTVSIVDTRTDRVGKTVLLRPAEIRGLPSATPLGMALDPQETTLYVALADLNAVAVVDLAHARVEGYIPVGWYPTAVALRPDGKKLLVANAKGVVARSPNGRPLTVPGGAQERYIQNLIEGTVATVDLTATAARRAALTEQTLLNNRVRTLAARLGNPGIEHIVYILKENRTYDQVLGDLPQGNGDPSLTLFGRDVTPNQHALAERFVLLDNFYCSAEVSGDGWNFSTAGMGSEYVERNVPYGYTGKARPYDYEGANNGVAVDRLGIPDAAAPPGGYLWDKARERRVSLRNYGMFAWDLKNPRQTAEEGTAGDRIEGGKKALADVTCPDFRHYDLTFADSDAWVQHRLPPAPRQRETFGPRKERSRIAVWRREYEQYLESGRMPRLMLVRLGRDHTAGTTPGQSSPRAMVADNDYAVGQLVETISRGPLWKKTLILVTEDDAQNGYDHVDAHRSIAFAISPFIGRGTRDSRFYNTDSILRTICDLLGLKPMNLYVAAATPFAHLSARPENDTPYAAILPSREILAEVNAQTAYRARDSARLIHPEREESMPDEELNDILWHALKGDLPNPPRRYRGKAVPAGRDETE